MGRAVNAESDRAQKSKMDAGLLGGLDKRKRLTHELLVVLLFHILRSSFSTRDSTAIRFTQR
jgi:hypothetical protein